MPLAFLDPQGDRGIEKLGHRSYVGGRWDEIGQLQFDFLIARGLKPQHYLLDIACGALRLGVKVIPYLEAGHYLGIEKESTLLEKGLCDELDPDVRLEKKPKLVASSSFEFEKLAQKADFAIAQSLFTHLTPDAINLCFRRLRPWLTDNGVFYATYYQTPKSRKNPSRPHDHGYFAYTEKEMMNFGTECDYSAVFIGDWGHPLGQVIVEYKKSTQKLDKSLSK